MRFHLVAIVLVICACAVGAGLVGPIAAAPSSAEVDRISINGIALGDSLAQVKKLWRGEHLGPNGTFSWERLSVTLAAGRVTAVDGMSLERNHYVLLPPQRPRETTEHGVEVYHLTTSSDVAEALGKPDAWAGGGFFSDQPRVMVYISRSASA